MYIINCLIFFCLIHEIYPKSNEIVFNKFEAMAETDPEFFDFGTLRIVKKSRKEFQFSGKFSIVSKLTNNGILSLTVFRLNNMGLPPVKIFYSSGGFCDQIKKNEQVYLDIVDQSNLPREYCPLQPGSYTVNDLVFNTDRLPDIFPLGEYKFMVTYTLNNDFKFGYTKLMSVIARET